MQRRTFRSQLGRFLVGKSDVEPDCETAAVLEMNGSVHRIDEPVLFVQFDAFNVDSLQCRRFRAHFNIENLAMKARRIKERDENTHDQKKTRFR